MSISSISSYANLFQNVDVDNRRTRENIPLEEVGGNRNTGPDTVSFSSEAMAQYLAMKNDSDSKSSERDGGQSFLDNQSSTSGKKSKKMDSAELLAFLKSDTFSEQAMGYVKSVAIADATNEDDEDEQDEIILNLGAKKQSEPTDTQSVDSGEMSIEEQANTPSGTAFVNGKRTDEKELAAEISKIEEEIKELTATYELIMGGEDELEEKVRMSQPIHKRIEERYKDLRDLKIQAQGLADQKNMMQTA